MVASSESKGLQDPFGDPVYKAAVIDVLGAVAYGEVSAVERLTDDAKMAPSLEDKTALLAMAAAQQAKIQPVLDRLGELGVDAYAAMEPLREGFDAFHTHTRPSDWWESLVKAYVGDGLANDFYREIAGYLDEETRKLVVTTLEDSGRADFVVDRVRAGIEADHLIGGRLALWGRRLMGEAITQTQQIAATREGLSGLIIDDHLPGLDLGTIGEMLTRITQRHVERMGKLGLEH
ncbi:tRNA-(MS[2]IO[6]A)-hydroxylase MiaE-like protein [Nocardioides albertanoniae]|uniref:tRNA-(MS[2]IO[6]A)-hydroxylase MiaE-like protein n=1 Tax=Nocardioides albertanoniae TaxID=1175486 RepID=A0A543A456_9ACTN|nr:ferritin-like fold-containing protein [Nocardioides albertanoniae]TQL67334.1 tRNA-(MS[2]IO[6]A)-hydroxylase MiaE-like protein [Nocardioides albertanoniae]